MHPTCHPTHPRLQPCAPELPSCACSCTCSAHAPRAPPRYLSPQVHVLDASPPRCLSPQVHVFETTIRLLGGLLSAHLLAAGQCKGAEHMAVPQYGDELLSLATDLGGRLLGAFDGCNVPASPATSPSLQPRHACNFAQPATSPSLQHRPACKLAQSATSPRLQPRCARACDPRCPACNPTCPACDPRCCLAPS